MKTQLLALTMGLMVASCASTETPPPKPPPKPPPDVPSTNDLHSRVTQADNEWAWFVSVGEPNPANIEAVKDTRAAYVESAENYIGLVNEFMVPLMIKPAPKKK